VIAEPCLLGAPGWSGAHRGRDIRGYHHRRHGLEPLLPIASDLAGDSGYTTLGQFLTRRTEPQRTLTWQPHTLGCSLRCSALRSHFYAQDSPVQPREARFERAALPVLCDRRYCNRVGFRKPYWLKCISLFVAYARGKTVGLSGQRSLHPHPSAGRSGWSTASSLDRDAMKRLVTQTWEHTLHKP